MYRYLIHYTHPGGNGGVEVVAPEPIRTMRDAEALAHTLRNQTGIPDLMVAAFSKFEEN